MIACGLTDIGLLRVNNQDSLFVSNMEDFPLFIVADGMGGHKAGEIASSIAVETIKDIFLQNRERIRHEKDVIKTIEESFKEANKRIYFQALNEPKYSGMGTTLTMAYLFKDEIYIGHIGDSRAYYIDNKGIRQITEDDSLVNELIKNGSITKEEALEHPQRNVITKALGTSIDIELDIQSYKYKKGDSLIICSDGLSNMVKEDAAIDEVKPVDDINQACEQLVGLVKENGGLDISL